MWLMLQQEKPEDFVVATGEVHSVRELVEVAFKEIGVEIVWVSCLSWQEQDNNRHPCIKNKCRCGRSQIMILFKAHLKGHSLPIDSQLMDGTVDM